MNSPQRIWNTQRANKWKNWSILALILLTVYFVFIRKPEPPTPLTVDNTPLLQEVGRLKDRNDKMSAVVAQLTVSQAQSRKYADSLAKALKIKPKYIRGVDQIVYSKDTVLKADTVFHSKGDTAFYMGYSDAWLDIEASSIRGEDEIAFSIRDTLTRTETLKNSLFKPTKREIIVRNANPYVEAQEAYSWTVAEKRPWLTVGPYVGYDIITQKPSLGLSVQFPLIQIK